MGAGAAATAGAGAGAAAATAVALTAVPFAPPLALAATAFAGTAFAFPAALAFTAAARVGFLPPAGFLFLALRASCERDTTRRVRSCAALAPPAGTEPANGARPRQREAHQLLPLLLRLALDLRDALRGVRHRGPSENATGF